MKIAPELKKSGLILGIGLLATGLIFYTLSALFNLQQRENRILAFNQSIKGSLLEVGKNYKLSTTFPDAVNVAKDVVEPLVTVRKKLENIYRGVDLEAREFVPDTEEVNMLLKLFIVDLEKAEAALKANATPDLETAGKAFQDAARVLEEASDFRQQVVKYLSWFVIIGCFGIAIGLAFYEFKSTRQEQVDLNSSKSLLDSETRRVEKLSGFIEAISSGNYSIDLSSGDQDELNSKLTVMRDKLKQNADDDQQRNWASAGLAQAGEILRSNTNSQDLYDSIIKFVVKYTHSNQGGLFIITDDEREKQLELVSCYAYERKKFLTRKVDIGQGIIGQCFLEKESIHLTQVPSDYVNITSGLGGANPNSLLLMPLKTNDEVYGVLELASFTAYKEFEMEWIARLAESIASTVASVRTNESTRLLLERTQQQAEEMKSQEEEMRQNMEELSATQEEMSRKEREYIARINELETQALVGAR